METILTLLSYLLGLVVAIISIPPILRVSRAKNLFEPFEERKVHTKVVPPLGGVAIFLGFTLSTIVSTDGYSFDALKYIIASVILMFFIGLKDDLIAISAKKKFVVQVFAAVLLVTLGGVQITTIHGMFGIEEIHHFTGLFLTLFIMLALVNAYNLVDGIDGLASGLAILAAVVFGSWFWLTGHVQFSVMSFALAGSLSGFFLYNVFGDKNKLFMGDTGSLVIGLVISTLVVKFNEFNAVKSIPFAVGAAPSVSFAIVIVPLIDTLRVITIRLLEKRSPFSPDKNHVHHRLLSLVNNHLQVTLIIITANVVLIAAALWFNHISFNVNMQFLLIFLLAVVFSFVPSIILRLKTKKEQKAGSIITRMLRRI